MRKLVIVLLFTVLFIGITLVGYAVAPWWQLEKHSETRNLSEFIAVLNQNQSCGYVCDFKYLVEHFIEPYGGFSSIAPTIYFHTNASVEFYIYKFYGISPHLVFNTTTQTYPFSADEMPKIVLKSSVPKIIQVTIYTIDYWDTHGEINDPMLILGLILAFSSLIVTNELLPEYLHDVD